MYSFQAKFTSLMLMDSHKGNLISFSVGRTDKGDLNDSS